MKNTSAALLLLAFCLIAGAVCGCRQEVVEPPTATGVLGSQVPPPAGEAAQPSALSEPSAPAAFTPPSAPAIPSVTVHALKPLVLDAGDPDGARLDAEAIDAVDSTGKQVTTFLVEPATGLKAIAYHYDSPVYRIYLDGDKYAHGGTAELRIVLCGADGSTAVEKLPVEVRAPVPFAVLSPTSGSVEGDEHTATGQGPAGQEVSCWVTCAQGRWDQDATTIRSDNRWETLFWTGRPGSDWSDYSRSGYRVHFKCGNKVVTLRLVRRG